MINKEDKEFLWDVQSNLLTELAFALYIKHIDDQNIDLEKRGKDYGAAYLSLSVFIKYYSKSKKYSELIKEAKIILRNDKIKNITNGIYKGF